MKNPPFILATLGLARAHPNQELDCASTQLQFSFPCASRICLTVCYGQDEMACHRHSSHCFLSTWGAFRLATPQVER